MNRRSRLHLSRLIDIQRLFLDRWRRMVCPLALKHRFKRPVVTQRSHFLTPSAPPALLSLIYCLLARRWVPQKYRALMQAISATRPGDVASRAEHLRGWYFLADNINARPSSITRCAIVRFIRISLVSLIFTTTEMTDTWAESIATVSSRTDRFRIYLLWVSFLYHWATISMALPPNYASIQA